MSKCGDTAFLPGAPKDLTVVPDGRSTVTPHAVLGLLLEVVSNRSSGNSSEDRVRKDHLVNLESYLKYFRVPHHPALPQPPQRSRREMSRCPKCNHRSTEEDNRKKLERTKAQLLQSGWYYPDIDRQEAHAMLSLKPLGRFLLRDSSQRNFLYSLSLKASRGIKNIRIHYKHGLFRLDSEEGVQMPQFDTIHGMLEYYINHQAGSRETKKCVWVDRDRLQDGGRVASMPIYLSCPVVDRCPSLLHLCRLRINKSANVRDGDFVGAGIRELPLPPSLISYMEQYPFSF